MAIRNFLKWFIIPVACTLGAYLSSSMVFGIGYSMLKDYAFWSGLVVFLSGLVFVMSWTGIGYSIAPQKNFAVQQAIAFPLILVLGAHLIFLYNWFFSDSPNYSFIADFRVYPDLFKARAMYTWPCLQEYNCNWTFLTYTIGIAVGFGICMNEENVFEQ